jgi:lipoate-protein ligase A
VVTPVRQRPDLSAVAPPAPALPATWLDISLPSAEENLALDEALLELAHEGLATTVCVRTWMAAEPTVVLGSSSRVDEEIDLQVCEAAGVRVVRRPSGGATVVLGPGCLMWSVITPHPAGVPPIEAIHASMLEPLAAAINETLPRVVPHAGWRVARRGTSDLAVSVDGESPERKVSGNALRVRGHGVLYHGTLLDRFDLGLVGRVLRHPPREPDYRSRRQHGDFLVNLDLGMETLERIVRTAFHATLTHGEWPRDRVARLVTERYGTSDWTSRL